MAADAYPPLVSYSVSHLAEEERTLFGIPYSKTREVVIESIKLGGHVVKLSIKLLLAAGEKQRRPLSKRSGVPVLENMNFYVSE